MGSDQPHDDGAFAKAHSLAVILQKKHWPELTGRWEPLDSTVGLLSQIDNMTSGMVRAAAFAEPGEEG